MPVDGLHTTLPQPTYQDICNDYEGATGNPNSQQEELKFLTREMQFELFPAKYTPPQEGRWINDHRSVTPIATNESAVKHKSLADGRRYVDFKNEKAFKKQLDEVCNELPLRARLRVVAMFSPPWGVLDNVSHDAAFTQDDMEVCTRTFLFDECTSHVPQRSCTIFNCVCRW